MEEPDPLLAGLEVPQIPHLFHLEVLHVNNFVEEQRVFPTITNLVTQHLFSLLDENKAAQLAIQLLRCTPPPDSSDESPVRSLYAPVLQIGDRPSPLAANFPVFFGMESPLADLVSLLGSQQPYVFDEEAIQEFPFPASVRSLVMFPIQSRAKLAGCFLVTSCISDFFTSERRKIVYGLCVALTLAFGQADFYNVQRLALANLPEFSIQIAHTVQNPLKDRRQTLRASLDEHGVHLNNQKLEILAIQELERDLIALQQKLHRDHIQESAPPVER